MQPQHFKLHEVAGGVWAAESDFTGVAIGNAAIIDAGGKTVVIDTFMTDVAADELRSTAERLTGNDIHLVVNSHWHGDHTNGNQVFADVPIVATEETLGRLLEEAPADRDVSRRQLRSMLDQLEQAVAQGDPAAARRLESGHVLLEFVDRHQLTLPDLLIEHRLVIEGERTVEIVTEGKGHTVSDVYVWVPDEGVVVTGDLCWAGIHPRMNDGFPVEWASYVEVLQALDPKHVIPGHGAPAGPEALADLPAYFRAVPALVKEVRAGADPMELAPPKSSEGWADLARFQASLQVLAER